MTRQIDRLATWSLGFSTPPGIDSRKKSADVRANPPADGELRLPQFELHMPEVKFDLSDLERMAHDVGGKADQIPFVMSQLLNDGAFKTRQVLVSDLWPRSVQVRNANFISAALHINKSDKHNLTVEIYDRLGHAHLKAHDVGGTKQVTGGKIAIPNQARIRIGARGVPPSQRPKAIIARTPKRALRITSRGIFVGQGGRLNMVYNFATHANIKADVAFTETFDYVMRENVRTGFADAMNKAMASRHPR